MSQELNNIFKLLTNGSLGNESPGLPLSEQEAYNLLRKGHPELAGCKEANYPDICSICEHLGETKDGGFNSNYRALCEDCYSFEIDMTTTCTKCEWKGIAGYLVPDASDCYSQCPECFGDVVCMDVCRYESEIKKGAYCLFWRHPKKGNPELDFCEILEVHEREKTVDVRVLRGEELNVNKVLNVYRRVNRSSLSFDVKAFPQYPKGVKDKYMVIKNG